MQRGTLGRNSPGEDFPLSQPLGFGHLGTPMRTLLILLVCALPIACAGTGSSSSYGSGSGGANQPPVIENAQPTAVSFRDYRTGMRMTVINDAYLVKLGYEQETADLRRAAFYSSRYVDVHTKVTHDAYMQGLMQFLDQQGYKQYSTIGAAPREDAGPMGWTTSVEVREGESKLTWRFDPEWKSYTKRNAPKEVLKYMDAKNGFLDFHRAIDQWSVGSLNDWDFSKAKVTEKESF